MAFDAFLKIDGVDGESTDDAHADWIEILSFSQGRNQSASATASSAGGATGGRVNLGDFSVTKFVDKASPKLAEACCTGKHISSIVIELCRAGGDKVKYMEYKLTNSIVAGVNYGGAAQSGDEIPVEEVAFNIGKIEWTYTQQKRPDGGGGGNVSAGWDLEKNVKV
jgi:type VI secretion system secreted protein Hcp